MNRILTFLFVLIFCSPAPAQDLPPHILADQYLLEATKALENGDPQGALRAFGKIEALDTEPPLDFLFFYGKLLVENSTALDDLLKGQSLLKQFVLNIDKDSEHYTPTLELLSMVGTKLGKAEAERRAEERRRAKEARQKAEEVERRAEAKRQAEEPLFDAVQRGEAENVKSLLAAGIDVHARGGSFDGTPLHHIATWGGVDTLPKEALDTAKVLLAAGADVHAKDNRGGTPLHRAARRNSGTTDIIKVLLAAGADVHAKNNWGRTPLHAASTVVNATVNCKDPPGLIGVTSDGQSIYDWTPDCDHIKVELLENARSLITAGADIHAKDVLDRTPLHWAAERGAPGIVRALLAAGANINTKDRDGQTPLAVNAKRARNPNYVHKGLTEGELHTLLETSVF